MHRLRLHRRPDGVGQDGGGAGRGRRAGRNAAGRDRQRRLGARLPRHGHRHRQAERGRARARAAPPDRHHRPGRGLFGGALRRRRAAPDRRDQRARPPAPAGGRHDAVLQGAVRGPGRDARGRPRACAPSSSAKAAAEGLYALYEELQRVDPVTAARLPPGDSQRIQRALEVYRVSGKPMSEHHGLKAPAAPHAPLIALEPRDRAWLHERIERRFRQMLADGLLREVRALRSRRELERRPAFDALRRLPPDLGGARQRHAGHRGRARHRGDAPARQAPAHLAAQHARAACRSPATHPTRRRRCVATVRALLERHRMPLLEVAAWPSTTARRRSLPAWTCRCRPASSSPSSASRASASRRCSTASPGSTAWTPARCASPAPTSRALPEPEAALLRRRRLGFVFQAFHVLPHLSVFHNVALPLLLLQRPDAARVREVLAAVGLAGTRERGCRSSSRAASCSASRSRARWCTGPT